MQTEHRIEINCEPPSRHGALVLQGGHRATCTCGWWSDCYAQMSDTQRAIDVHIRRSTRQDFDALLARSSIGAAVADIKTRGIKAHLDDLEREMNRRRPKNRRCSKRPRQKKPLSAEDAAFMRGFGIALATIWRCQHDGQMVRQLIKQNNFTLASFQRVGLLDADYDAIRRAVQQ